MNINVGDKIFAKEATWIADKGKVGVVTKVSDNLISFEFDGNSKVSCTMDFDTFNHYFAKVEEKKVEAPKITEDEIDEILENSEFITYTVFDKCTVVSCKLPNGFVITESSACVSPENYNEEMGEEICFNNIKNKVWELEGYLLQQMMYEANNCDECDGCPCGC